MLTFQSCSTAGPDAISADDVGPCILQRAAFAFRHAASLSHGTFLSWDKCSLRGAHCEQRPLHALPRSTWLMIQATLLQVSYHTHIPEYIPKYTWKGLVGPMWRVIRFNILMADLTLVPSKTMKVCSH